MDSLPTPVRIPLLRRLAADGDAHAQLEWSWALCLGRGVPEDEDAARSWLERAAAQGLASAQRTLADELRTDAEPEADAVARARDLERMAARAGCPYALRTLALPHLDDLSDPRVKRRVRRLLERSLAGGHGYAGYDLAMRVETLGGDLRRVARWLRRAATVDHLEVASLFTLDFLRLAKPVLKRFGRRSPDLWRVLAEAGDPDAQTCLGYAHRLGRGVAYAPREARRLWESAANGGHAEACLALVLLRVDEELDLPFDDLRRWAKTAAASGRPIALWGAAEIEEDADDADTHRVTAWLLEGARQGDPRCAHEYANRFLRRSDASRHRRSEAHWHRVGAEGGIAEAQIYLAEMLENGEGVRRNTREAVRWLRRAASQGDPDAQLKLGVHLHEGQGVRRDDRESVRWYRRAAANGDAHAMHNLGLCFKKGHGVRRDVPRALRLFERAAVVHENPGSARQLGSAYDDGWAGRKDPAVAARWWRRGAALGDAESMELLGVAYHNGKGVPKDYEFSVLLYRAAALEGDSWAAYCLGLCHRDGEGVAKDPRRARSWFQRAARMAHQERDANTTKHASRALAATRA